MARPMSSSAVLLFCADTWRAWEKPARPGQVPDPAVSPSGLTLMPGKLSGPVDYAPEPDVADGPRLIWAKQHPARSSDNLPGCPP
jgi:hypothetical protein